MKRYQVTRNGELTGVEYKTRKELRKTEGEIRRLRARLSAWAMLEDAGEDRRAERAHDRAALRKALTWVSYVQARINERV